MVAFEIDCRDGKGDKEACHHVAEFYSVIKVELIYIILYTTLLLFS